MNIRFASILLVTGSLAIFSSCSNDDENNPVATTLDPLAVNVVSNLAADTSVASSTPTGPPAVTGHFTLFNLKTGRQVSTADSATTQWDLGFRATAIIVNGGSSGPGQGGASVLSGVFADVDSLILETGVPVGVRNATVLVPFQTDSATGVTARAIPSVSDGGWYNYNTATNIITPLPGRVLAIRTADGKFAKVEIVSYYKGAPAVPSASDKSRFYTFRYTYQPDGSGRVK
jgi:hypothetical protein